MTRKPFFVPFISLGNVLSIITMAIAGLVVISEMRGTLRVLEHRLIEVEAARVTAQIDRERMIRIDTQVTQLMKLLEKRGIN